VRVECLAQENNAMYPARARTATARSRVKLTNHEATASPTRLLTVPGILRFELFSTDHRLDVFPWMLQK